MKTFYSDNLDCVSSAGAAVVASRVSPIGCTLADATTYYFVLASSEAPIVGDNATISAHLKWAAAVVAVFTIEGSCFPLYVGGSEVKQGPFDVHAYSSTAGDWLQFNPANAYVPVSGASNTVTAATVTTGGSAAGGAILELMGASSRRYRIKAVVTTGGLVRVGMHAKEHG